MRPILAEDQTAVGTSTNYYILLPTIMSLVTCLTLALSIGYSVYVQLKAKEGGKNLKKQN